MGVVAWSPWPQDNGCLGAGAYLLWLTVSRYLTSLTLSVGWGSMGGLKSLSYVVLGF